MTYILTAHYSSRSPIMNASTQSTESSQLTQSTEFKDERINLRLQPSTKLMLERAASFEGQSVSKFILNSALAQAEQTIKEHEVLQLNAQDAQAFFDALDQPVNFNRKLLDALAEHETRVLSR